MGLLDKDSNCIGSRVVVMCSTVTICHSVDEQIDKQELNQEGILQNEQITDQEIKRST